MDCVGEDAVVSELGAHISFPGAAAQGFHTDHPWQPELQVVSCFIALHDVPEHLGPTELFPGSQLAPAHVHDGSAGGCCSGANLSLADPCPDDGTVCLRCSQAGQPGGVLPCVLGTGDVLLMDARVVHRGGARRHEPEQQDGHGGGRSGARRSLLYFSTKRADALLGADHAPSLMPRYTDRLALGKWESWVSGLDAAAPVAASAGSFMMQRWLST
eukprot:SAG22_NODE_396_length_11127_cov_33.460011_3_plen_215_part_00